MKTENKTAALPHPIKAIRRAAVSLCAFESADPAATIAAITTALNGKTGPLLQWDCSRGLQGLNDEGVTVAQQVNADPQLPLDQLLALLAKVDATNVVLFAHNMHRFITNEFVAQAVWNLRDAWKARTNILVMLAPLWKLPEELRHDVIVVNEVLPDADELEDVVRNVLEAAPSDVKKTPEESVKKASVGLLGCPAFSAEQFASMALTKTGLDLREVARLRRSYIGQLPGVEIREDEITFEDIAGYEVVKKLFRRKMAGKRPPQIVVWWDELEKAVSAAGSDMSGVTQDQIGVLLTWLQDRLNQNRLSAVLLVGFPGTGKSAISMALRNEARCECIRMDFGGMKDSLVGGSEQRIRAALKGIDAIGGGQIIVVATCNNAANLPSALTSRFALGTYFFDLPEKWENEALWKIKRDKYGIKQSEKTPTSIGWTGREIQQCCFVADDLSIPLTEAAQYITPFVATGAREIDALRDAANGRYLSASKAGMYRKEAAPTGRRLT